MPRAAEIGRSKMARIHDDGTLTRYADSVTWRKIGATRRAGFCATPASSCTTALHLALSVRGGGWRCVRRLLFCVDAFQLGAREGARLCHGKNGAISCTV